MPSEGISTMKTTKTMKTTNSKVVPRITTEGRTPLQDVIPLDTPYLVFLDPSDICNAHCFFCPSGDPGLLKQVGRKPQIMDFDLYGKILADLCNMPRPIKTLRMYKDGEPLLNPLFPEMVRLAKDTSRFGQIDTTTNGLLLGPKMNDRLVWSGLDKIFISVPFAYDLEYIKNVRDLYRKGRHRLHVHVKMIIDGVPKAREMNFMETFGGISDSISVEHMAPCWPEGKTLPVNRRWNIYGQPLPKKAVKVCPYIFYSLAINSDGTVSLCFLDWKHIYIVGDLKKQNFWEIWNGETLKWLRRTHLRGERKTALMCRDCGQLRYGAPDNIDAYAKDILRRPL